MRKLVKRMKMMKWKVKGGVEMEGLVVRMYEWGVGEGKEI